MSAIVTLDLAGWRPPLAPGMQEAAVRAIEDGGVLVLPHVNFALCRARAPVPVARLVGRPRQEHQPATAPDLKGARGDAADLSELKAMVGRFAANAAELVVTLFPRYAQYVQRARTSFRPQTGRRQAGVVAQGRFAPACRCVSFPSQSW